MLPEVIWKSLRHKLSHHTYLHAYPLCELSVRRLVGFTLIIRGKCTSTARCSCIDSSVSCEISRHDEGTSIGPKKLSHILTYYLIQRHFDSFLSLECRSMSYISLGVGGRMRSNFDADVSHPLTNASATSSYTITHLKNQ